MNTKSDLLLEIKAEKILATLEFRWSVSRGRYTHGYRICSLFTNGQKIASCNGGGYDMQGTCLGQFVQSAFREELQTLTKEFYGLTFHDPNFKPGQAVIDGQTIKEREKAGLSLGLERYQAFYKASSSLPTPSHTVPSIDGGCGFSCVQRILTHLGYRLRYVQTRSKNLTLYSLVKEG